jgi:hypothetical protein
MAQLGYEIVAHEGGWAILLTPGRSSAFTTLKDAYDEAASLAHKLRFVGYAVDIRGERRARDRGPPQADAA